MSRYISLVLGSLAVLAAGCEAPPTSELVKLNVPDAVVDPSGSCDECEDYEQVLTTVVYETNAAILDAVYVDILQYTVQLRFDQGLAPAIARQTGVRVVIGGKGTMGTIVADPAVRTWVNVRYGDVPTTAKATLTAYGYDHRNELVEVKRKFDVLFEKTATP